MLLCTHEENKTQGNRPWGHSYTVRLQANSSFSTQGLPTEGRAGPSEGLPARFQRNANSSVWHSRPSVSRLRLIPTHTFWSHASIPVSISRWIQLRHQKHHHSPVPTQLVIPRRIPHYCL